MTPRRKLDTSRRSRRPDERPSEIMEAALELFSTQGFRATTLDQVAEAAGVTKGAIYHYFQGKDDLLLKSMNAYMSTVGIPPEEAATESGPASARLRLLVHYIWDRWRDPKAARFTRLVEGELVPDFPEVVAQWLTESVLPMFDSVQALLDEGIAAGEFRRDLDTAVVGQYLLLGTVRMAETQASGAERNLLPTFPAERVIDSILDVYFRGIRTSANT